MFVDDTFPIGDLWRRKWLDDLNGTSAYAISHTRKWLLNTRSLPIKCFMTSNLLFTKQQTLNLCLRLKVGWTTKRVQHPRRGSCLVASPSAVQICSIRPYTWPCYRSTWSTPLLVINLFDATCFQLPLRSFLNLPLNQDVKLVVPQRIEPMNSVLTVYNPVARCFTTELLGDVIGRFFTVFKLAVFYLNLILMYF